MHVLAPTSRLDIIVYTLLSHLCLVIMKCVYKDLC